MAGNNEDVVLSLGFDLSSLPKQVATIERILKNQKLIANIAYQFGTSQGAVRNQLKGFMSSLQSDINSKPLQIPIETDNLPRIRYALYDVANITSRISKDLFQFGKAAVTAAADFESAFTSVERTTMANNELLGSLRSQLEGLSRDIPMAFKDITEIASLGAQLGIASGDLTGFARTVAEFSAVTNVSATQAAQSFGALGELLNIGSDQYQNLGSAIAQVGVNSVATESEILSVSTQIAGVASSAGLSAEYVVGLSGALASLRVPAEQSRGALTRVFQEINRAAAEGGPAIQGFANVLGVSTEEATRLAKTDVQSFFSKFISGLSSLDNTSLTTTLDELNLSELRVTNTLTRLSRNTDLLATTQGDASKAFEDGTFLAAAYALKAEDLAAKLTILSNSFQELVATFGESILPIIGPVVDGVSSIIQGLTDALSTESGKWASGIGLSSAFIVAGLLGVISTIALVTASLFALKTAINGLGWTAAMGGAKGLAASLWGTAAAAGGATTGVKAMSLALKAIPIIAIIGTLAALATAFTEAGNSADVAFQKFVGDTTGLSDALIADTDAYNALSSAQEKAASGAVEVQYAGTNIGDRYGEAAQKISYTAQVLGKDVPDSAYAASSALDYNTRVIGENTEAWFANMLMQNEAFQTLAGNEGFADFVEATGYSVSEAFRLQASEGEDAAQAYFYRVASAYYDGSKEAYDVIAAVDVDLANAIRDGNNAIANSDASGGAVWANTFGANFLKALGPLGDWLQGFGNWLTQIVSFGNASQQMTGTGEKLQNTYKGLIAKSSIMDLNLKDVTSSSYDAADGFNAMGGAANGATKKIYLLTDYAADLASIWERAFDIRFSGNQTLDKITSSFRKIAEAAAAARQEIEDINQSINELNADIQSLTADRALQEYFLTVAEAYGDTLNAQKIRGELAKIDSDLAAKNSDLTKKNQALQKAQDKTNKTLVGNSDAAIENRGEILDLVSAYQSHIKALAASGLKEDELRAATAQLKADFIAQATQLGYNVDELGYYAVAFDDVKKAIDAVPRELTVDFNGDPALTAIEEFAAKSRAAIAGAGGTVKVDTQVTQPSLRVIIDPSDVKLYRKALDLGKITEKEFYKAVYGVDYGRFATGGFVSGPGGPTSDSIPARLSDGEYVVRAAAVKQYGVGFFNQLNQMKTPAYYSGGPVGGAANGGMVSLSPEDRALLRNVGGSGNIVLYADSRELARSVNDGNRQIVASGGRP